MEQDTTKSIFKWISKLEEFILATAMIIMASLTILNVFTRSLFNHSLAWAQEITQFLIILICFVGLSYGARCARHIRMTAIYDQLSRRHRKVMTIFISAATAALLFYLAWHAFHYVYIVYDLGSVSPVLEIPLFIVYLAAPLGLIMAGIQYVLAVVRNLSKEDVYLSYTHKDEYEDAPEIGNGDGDEEGAGNA